jgi:glycosyltransferase involved in cell wall biosynthesis
MTDSRLVSAVIPTRGRPEMLLRAVHTALEQTHKDLEVIVIIDGPDLATAEGLSQLSDPRVRVIALSARQGGSFARNVGIAAAHGDWIAFLDDDDEWLPQKIEIQLDIARRSAHSLPVVASRFVARTPEAEYVWPRRIPAPAEDVSDYLFSRSTLFQGEGYMATPTLFAKRELLLRLPFRPHIKKHEDWDWVLRAARHEGVGFEFAQEPLAVVRTGATHRGVSNQDDWRFSLAWIKERREYVSPRAYAAFIFTVVADQASRQATLGEYLALVPECWRHGQPTFFQFLLYAGMRAFPRSVRHHLRRHFQSGS